MVQNLIMNIVGGPVEKYENQHTVVRKFGPTRLRALELLNLLLSLMYPSKNLFAHCMRDFAQSQDNLKAFNEKYQLFEMDEMETEQF